jgi:RNA polymerase sigma factor for flagellar operon FliA
MYTASGTLDRDQLAKHYAPLVKRIAYHLDGQAAGQRQVEDIIQNGLLGLLDAMSRYEEGHGAQFETYAVQRIRGAMLDGLRENDWLPRSLRKRHAPHRNGDPRSSSEKAGRRPKANWPRRSTCRWADYQKMLQEARGYQLVYFDDFTDGDDDDYLDRHSRRPATSIRSRACSTRTCARC